MEGRAITLCGVPALVWGGDSARCILAVHGMMSHKADTPIRLLAEVAAAQGIQVVSIDLPDVYKRQPSWMAPPRAVRSSASGRNWVYR